MYSSLQTAVKALSLCPFIRLIPTANLCLENRRVVTEAGLLTDLPD